MGVNVLITLTRSNPSVTAGQVVILGVRELLARHPQSNASIGGDDRGVAIQARPRLWPLLVCALVSA